MESDTFFYLYIYIILVFCSATVSRELYVPVQGLKDFIAHELFCMLHFIHLNNLV